MNQHNLSRKKCPYCEDTDCIVMDYTAGEVVCTSCAMVLHVGLVEQEDTVFHEDFTGRSIDDGGRTASAAAENAGRPAKSSDDEHKRSSYKLLEILRSRAGLPEAVSELAYSYFKQFKDLQAQRQLHGVPNKALVCVCFMLASSIRGTPVQINEIISYRIEADLKPSALADAERKVIQLLQLESSVEEARKKLYPDLMQLYLGRINNPALQLPKKFDFARDIALVARSYHAVVQSRYTASQLCCALIFMCRVSKPIAEYAGVRHLVDKETMKVLWEEAIRAAREDDKVIKTIVRDISVQNIEKMLQEARRQRAELAASTNTSLRRDNAKEGEKKRPRAE